MTPDGRKRISIARTKPADQIGYDAAHKRIQHLKPKTGKCEECGITDKRTENAYYGKNGEFSANPNDYRELCQSCHIAFDQQKTTRDIEPRICDECGAGPFKGYQGLNAHNSHKNVKHRSYGFGPYTCDYCSAGSFSLNALAAHNTEIHFNQLTPRHQLYITKKRNEK
jgi:hypothetical protein